MSIFTILASRTRAWLLPISFHEPAFLLGEVVPQPRYFISRAAVNSCAEMDPCTVLIRQLGWVDESWRWGAPHGVGVLCALVRS